MTPEERARRMREVQGDIHGRVEDVRHQVPRRIKGAPRRSSPPPAGDDDASDRTGTPIDVDDVRRETERWAPESLRDTVIQTEKICRVCGKDLHGHRRYRDASGYICPSCDREERAKLIPCAECGKPSKPAALRPWGPVVICTRCWAEHQNDPKAVMRRKVSTRHYEEEEKRNVLLFAGIVVALLIVLLLLRLAF